MSILSAGILIRDLLLADADVTAITDKVFPVAVDEAKLPYIVYTRDSATHDPVKGDLPGADSAIIEVGCCAATYKDSISLAEAVRSALLYKQTSRNGNALRVCYMSDAKESFEGDAYVQRLFFTIKV